MRSAPLHVTSHGDVPLRAPLELSTKRVNRFGIPSSSSRFHVVHRHAVGYTALAVDAERGGFIAPCLLGPGVFVAKEYFKTNPEAAAEYVGTVVVKVLNKQVVRDRLRAGWAEDPWREMRIMRQLGEPGHPGLMPLADVLEDDLFVFQVMPCFVSSDGSRATDLYYVLHRRKTLPDTVAWALTRQLFEAVGYIHSRGFAHCDISIENVLCATGSLPADPDGWRCFVIDFGQAVQTDSRGRCPDLATRSPTLKVLYQGPEVYDHPRSTNAFGLDAWALACVVWQLYGGLEHPLFSDTRGTCPAFLQVAETKSEDVLARAALLRSIADAQGFYLRRRVCELLARLLAIDPDARVTPLEVLASWDVYEAVPDSPVVDARDDDQLDSSDEEDADGTGQLGPGQVDHTLTRGPDGGGTASAVSTSDRTGALLGARVEGRRGGSQFDSASSVDDSRTTIPDSSSRSVEVDGVGVFVTTAGSSGGVGDGRDGGHDGRSGGDGGAVGGSGRQGVSAESGSSFLSPPSVAPTLVPGPEAAHVVVCEPPAASAAPAPWRICSLL